MWELSMELGFDYFILDGRFRNFCVFGELFWRYILWDNYNFFQGLGCGLFVVDFFFEEYYGSVGGSLRSWFRMGGLGVGDR